MLEPGKCYHIYNRGNNRENLFYKPENYNYFLRLFKRYTDPVLDMHAYCLLPNHFHLLVRIKEEDCIQDLGSFKDFPSLVSDKFRRLFMAYAKAINVQQKRTGSLFQKNFKAKDIDKDAYFSQAIFYIHANPQIHGLIGDFRKWPHSSYDELKSNYPVYVRNLEAVYWFGSTDHFCLFHQEKLEDMKLDAGMEE